MKDLQKAVYLAVKDSDFRRRLIYDLKGAIESIGLRLGDEELTAIIKFRKIFSFSARALVTTILASDPNWRWL
jgi:hypothetical protein